jgi:hypothetical protein
MKNRASKQGASAATLPETARRRLEELHRTLLRLHKVLLEDERASYEREHGRTSPQELLQLLISHAQFTWLRAISETIVRIDEIVESGEPSAAAEAAQLIAHTRSLLVPAEQGAQFARKYHGALQRLPDAVLAHRAVSVLLKADA